MDFYLTALIQGLGYSGMGLGIYISLRVFQIPDITTDGSFTLGGAVTAVCIVSGLNPIVTLLFALVTGMLAGMITGVIHTRLRVNALLAGILVMTALYSVNLAVMGRSNLPLPKSGFSFLSETNLSLVSPQMALIMVSFTGITALSIFWLLRTDYGIAMRATGQNDQMATANGVNTVAMKITGLGLANGCTALSGYLLVQYQGFADVNMGIGIVISGLAAVMMGDALLHWIKNTNLGLALLFVVVGSILFRFILAMALSLGLNPNYLKLVTATIVLLFVTTTLFRRKKL
jgi:putative tryptophan/tyrosine transport system permease protein